MHSTLNRQQTSDRLEQYVRDSVAALAPAKPTLRPLGKGEVPCDDPTDNGAPGRITLDTDYFLDGVPRGGDAAPLFDQILTYRTSHGFRLLRDERPTTQAIRVENNTDGFRIGLDTTKEGSISLTVSSPCIWPMAQRNRSSGGTAGPGVRWRSPSRPLRAPGSTA